MKKRSTQIWEASTFSGNSESRLMQHDYKKSGTILLSSVQGFQDTYDRRTSTKNCLLYTSSRTKGR